MKFKDRDHFVEVLSKSLKPLNEVLNKAKNQQQHTVPGTSLTIRHNKSHKGEGASYHVLHNDKKVGSMLLTEGVINRSFMDKANAQHMDAVEKHLLHGVKNGTISTT